MILLIGTKNGNKIKEISAILMDFDVEIKSLLDFPDIDDVEETGTTFETNAKQKAEAWARMTGLMTIADDSGLCVDALDGAPGVYSARYVGLDKDYAANNEKLLKVLKNTPEQLRTAHFITVIACATPENGTLFTVTGTVDGLITRELRGDNGFGYDPLFFYPPENATFAEIPAHKKNRLSHRFHALEAFKQKFTDYF
ncbi:MAG: XTP/dITP diphosphatase [Candidatus Heimdallarchaeota archaeon]|nr:XTP/dITP diphosphatase [Candidatus Heimdallarchaeota archaeon]